MLLSTFARYEEAEAALPQAQRLTSDIFLSALYTELAHLEEERGRLKAAERYHRRAISLKPSTQNLTFLASLLIRQGRFPEAKRLCKKAISATTSSPHEACSNLGLIARSQRQYRQALAFFNHALKINPRNPEARQARRDVMAAVKLRSTLRPQKPSRVTE